MKIDNKELLNWLDTLTLFTDKVLSGINKNIDKIDNFKLHTIFTICVAMNYYVKGIKVLLENKQIITSNIILRSIIEGFINLEYISQDETQKRAIAYVFEDFKERVKRTKTYKEIITKEPSKSNLIPELSTPEKCDKCVIEIEKEKRIIITNLKKNYNINFEEKDFKLFNINLYKRAKKANLKYLYKILYPHLSGLSHIGSSGLKNFIKWEGDRYLININEDDNEIRKATETTFRIHLLSIENLTKQFGIYSKKRFKPFYNELEKLNINK